MKKIITVLLGLFYLLLTNACGIYTFDSRTVNPTGAEANPEVLHAGRRNLWETNLTMALLTGAVSVDGGKRTKAQSSQQGTSNIQKINKTWQDVSGMMATNNSISGCDPATQIATFKLASAYCNRLVNSSVAWQAFVEKNFGKANPNTLSKDIIAATMLDSLQAGSKLNNKQREKSITTIVNYLNNNGGNGDSVSKEMLFDVCTMVLGSASTTYN